MITGSNETVSITDKLWLIDSIACIAVGKTSTNYCPRIFMIRFPECPLLFTHFFPSLLLTKEIRPDAL